MMIVIIIITNRFDFNLHLRTFENHILSSDLHKECQGWFEYYTTRHQQDCAECLTKLSTTYKICSVINAFAKKYPLIKTIFWKHRCAGCTEQNAFQTQHFIGQRLASRGLKARGKQR